MAIGIKIIGTRDVFEDSDSVVLKKDDVPDWHRTVPNIGAVTFLTTRHGFQDSLEDLVVHCGWECLEEFGRFSGNQYRIWCFVSDECWQAPTRVIRYKKLWRYHKELLQSPGIGEIGPEIEFQSEKEIRYASMVEVSGEALVKALKLLRANASCAMILSRRQDIAFETQVRAIFDHAFPDLREKRDAKVNVASLSVYACSQGDALIRVWGFFDDVEASADLIANQTTIDEFARFLEKRRR